MTKNPFSKIFHTAKPKTAWLILVLLLLFGAGTGYFFVSEMDPRFFRSQSGEEAKTAPGIENIGDGWWEAGDVIYHGIPAKVVFQIPQGCEKTPEQISAAAWNEFDRIGKIFNPFDPASEVAHLNSQTQPRTIPVSDDIFAVIRLSRALWIETSGSFDPTMWPIKQLWQAAEQIQKVPNETDITAALKWTGLDNVKILEIPERAIAFSDHPVQFDFGGIVKGYAVDQVREILLHERIVAGLVQLGEKSSLLAAITANPGVSAFSILGKWTGSGALFHLTATSGFPPAAITDSPFKLEINPFTIFSVRKPGGRFPKKF